MYLGLSGTVESLEMSKILLTYFNLMELSLVLVLILPDFTFFRILLGWLVCLSATISR